MGEIFNEVLVRPIINILVAIYQLLNLMHFPYALGFSIILLTILVRFILYPFINTQLKASRKMQELSPHLSKLKEKHKGDAKRIQAETMKLYKEHGVNPAAGCLPMLIQLPIIWALYSVLQKVVGLNPTQVVAEINKLLYNVDFLKLNKAWDTTFFGLPLGTSPIKLIDKNNIFSPMNLIIIVPILTALFQFAQSKMMFSKPVENTIVKDKKAKEEKKDDFASVFQSQSMYLFPLMIGFFSFSFPIGLSLYWNTFTLFGILQQYKISGWGGLADYKKKIQSLIK